MSQTPLGEGREEELGRAIMDAVQVNTGESLAVLVLQPTLLLRLPPSQSAQIPAWCFDPPHPPHPPHRR